MESSWSPQGRAETRAGGIAWPVGGFWENIKGVLLNPNQFFSRLPTGDGYSAPLLFAVFWGVFAAVFGGLTHFGLTTFDPSAWLISLAVAPVMMAAQAFISSGVLQGFVRLWMGTSNAGFGTTFRVWCYASAGYVLYVIPFAGPWIAGIYAWLLMIVGLRAAHSASAVKAAGAMLTAVVALFIIATVSGAVFGAVGFEITDRTLNILLP